MEQNLKVMGNQFGYISYSVNTKQTSNQSLAIYDELNASLETIANFDDSLPAFNSSKYDSKTSEDKYTTQQIIDAFSHSTPNGADRSSP